jgi:hypothetical protein
MKNLILLFICTLLVQLSFGQNNSNEYSKFIKKANSLYKEKNYKESALAYSNAFKSNSWQGKPNDRYNAACSWALAKISDSSFYHLNGLASKGNYMNYEHITTDTDLISLHNDKRWKPLLEIVKKNKEKAESNLNKSLVSKLDSIHTEDQKYRLESEEIEKKYGWESKEVKAIWKIINQKDSINLIKIKDILDKEGWLGSDIIGQKGNSTLFLVIQHSDIKTQEKYLPMMREAVKNGKAPGSSLALLEDRVLLRQGKRQIYGSQIGMDSETQKYYVLPLDDPENVDKRREEVGLQPLAEYVNIWEIEWDIKQYKKDLPIIEAKEKRFK